MSRACCSKCGKSAMQRNGEDVDNERTCEWGEQMMDYLRRTGSCGS